MLKDQTAINKSHKNLEDSALKIQNFMEEMEGRSKYINITKMSVFPQI